MKCEAVLSWPKIVASYLRLIEPRLYHSVKSKLVLRYCLSLSLQVSVPHEVIRESLVNFHADLQGTIDHNNEAVMADSISTKSNAPFNNEKCCIRLRSLPLSLVTPYKNVPRGILQAGRSVPSVACWRVADLISSQ